MLDAVSFCCFICGILIGATSAGPVYHGLLEADNICQVEGTLFGGLYTVRGTRDTSDDEKAGKVWLERYNRLSEGAMCRSVVADWNYSTNLTDHNQDASIKEGNKLAAFLNEAYEGAMTFNWRNFSGPVRRHFSKVVDIGVASLDKVKFNRYTELSAALGRNYSTAVVCNKPGDTSGKCYPLDPDLTEIMSTSRDWDELSWAWEGWREASGNTMPEAFSELFELQNEAADINGFEDGGDFWRSSYETANFREMCKDLWTTVKPLYEQLHAFARRRLRQQYPNNTFPSSGHIPAHLLGDMWGQQWKEIEPILRPYPDTPGVDVTDEMIKQGYDVKRIFKLAEEFFTSIGMEPMVDSFWTDSMVSKPKDAEAVCHASAWDFYNQKNFRIKQCTEIDMHWLFVTHHEMGHVVYFMQYKDQPTDFRNGANSGFHEAIGDIMELSASTPEHLNEIGLLPDFKDSDKLDINFLMDMALRKVSFLPFGYLIDLWRWDVFAGKTTPQTYNRDWWNLRCSTQGVIPPVSRSSSDFDAGAKFHVANNVPYIRYFISSILQFQIHRSLCEASNSTRPLHRCDIYRSKEAGKIMRALMQPGSSKPWPDVLEGALGTREMKADAMIEYFQPLMDFLKAENEKTGEKVGWDSECPFNTP